MFDAKKLLIKIQMIFLLQILQIRSEIFTFSSHTEYVKRESIVFVIFSYGVTKFIITLCYYYFIIRFSVIIYFIIFVSYIWQV